MVDRYCPSCKGQEKIMSFFLSQVNTPFDGLLLRYFKETKDKFEWPRINGQAPKDGS